MAKRTDRVMAWVISIGGLSIIAAVLGILVFITQESLPLFRGPRTRNWAALQSPMEASGALLDESGKALVLLDAEHGVRALTLPSGALLPCAPDGPPKPWKALSAPDAQGHFSVCGADGRLSSGHIAWDKPAGQGDPSQWTLSIAWTSGPAAPEGLIALFATRPTEASGLGSESGLRFLALASGGLVWAQQPLPEGQPEWRSLDLPSGLHPTAAQWSADAHRIWVGSREGDILLWDAEAGRMLARSSFGEPVTALGFALGQNALLVGGAKGRVAAFQQLQKDGSEFPILQEFHRFAPLQGPVQGFMASLRDKRFLAWSPASAAVLHLTSEKRLCEVALPATSCAALGPRGDCIALAGQGGLRAWTLDAGYPEASPRALWGKVHFEGYEKPEYVWQSSGASDDFEPKLSLIPLLFGTLKGTLYAMLFALPLAVLGALYTSQFASPRLRRAIKPTVEIMAALPSVVLGFIAGLLLAPLFEKSVLQVFLVPGLALLVALPLLGLHARLPRSFKTHWIQGREVLWAVPVLLLGLLAALWVAPLAERIFLGGDFRAWLYQHHGIAYDQRNSLVVGFAMGFAVIPIIFTISEDALSSVPRALTSASLACGASPWQTAWRVVLPTASPGIFSAVMVGLGRAIGETMIVLMATGNTPLLDWNPFNGMRTLSANIAVEISEAPVHGALYRVLFLTALLLFLLTFLLNTVAELVSQHLRKRYESL